MPARKSEFDKFVERQQALAKTADPLPINWSTVRDNWLGELDNLYEQVTGFLQSYIRDGRVQIDYKDLVLNEDNIGSYLAKQMLIRIGRQEVTLTPIGTLLIGSRGRVDVRGPAGETRIVLVDKKAITARSLIQIRVHLAGDPPPPPINVPDEISLEWKLVSRPPEMKLTPVTQEAFLSMILEVADA